MTSDPFTPRPEPSGGGIFIVVGLLVGLVIGYFGGREHIKYEIRQTASGALNVMKGAITNWGARFPGRDAKPKSPTEVRAYNEMVAYINDHIEIYEVEAKYIKDILDGTVAAVFGKLKNTGQRSVSTAVVTVYFLDNSGQTIFEDSYFAVSSGAIFSSDGPLREGYIRPFGFKVKKVPSEWEEGKIKIGVTKVRFSETSE